MKDTELIAMCNTPEIQDRWKPKVGDRCSSRHPHFMGPGMIVRYYDEDAPMVFDRGDNTAPLHKIELIHIPRIEDVLEWLVPTHCHTWKNALDMAMGIDRHVPQMPSNIEQALLMVYMYWQEDKTWNGEAWA